MLTKPSSCSGCSLAEMGEGFMTPSLSQHGYGVALIGEALGETERDAGEPFVGKAGFKLTRLIEWAGFDRGRFDIWNAVWCRPPGNILSGSEYESSAIAHCRTAHWDKLIARASILVPMGNTALNALTGRKGILETRGYVRPGPSGTLIVPTVHPSFIQRGQSKYSAAFIHDLQKAVNLTITGLPAEFVDYRLDPSPAEAYAWALEYLHQTPLPRLAFDIETPYKGEDEGDLDTDDDSDETYTILRVGFSYRGLSALSVPFAAPYYPAIRLLLSSPGEKVVWNASFDVPRLAANGFPLNGPLHDGMVAWHVLHSDLPKGLAFVATFTCPYQEEWKHLSKSRPAFYNATDADVEWRSMEVIERELRRVGLWQVYERDVLELDPILTYMSSMGMPIDPLIREEKAEQLAIRQADLMTEMESLIPPEARRIAHVYKSPPKERTGLSSRRGSRSEHHCSRCGAPRPGKAHFKRFVKKNNPCADAGTVDRIIDVDEYYRLAPFKPSREQLMRYQAVMNRPVPGKWDKKLGRRRPSMDARSIKDLMRKYPLDKLYQNVLDYRQADKIAGTYIGRPAYKEHSE